jgi:hypothetical protein
MMLKYSFLISFTIAVSNLQLNAQGLEWVKQMGSVNMEYPYSMTLDGSGNVYTTGRFQGTVDFDPGVGVVNLTATGNYDIFISKLDSSGNYIWAKQVGGIDEDCGRSIVTDVFGNVYITGYFKGTVDFDPGSGVFNLTSSGYHDIFISKLDAFGNFVWAKQMGGAGPDYSYSIDLDVYGNIYTTGTFQGTADFDPGVGANNFTSLGGEDIFISKLDVFGNYVWAKQMGGISQDFGVFTSLDAFGNVYITGSFKATADFDPGAGITNFTSAGSEDAYITKLDTSGNFVWAKQLGGTGWDRGNFLVFDALGNIYITGTFQDTVDFDPGVNVFNLTSAGNEDAYITKLDASGNFVWAKQLGGTGSDYGFSIAIDDSGNLYTAGYFQGVADFDPGSNIFNLTSMGSYDVFISKLDASGNFIWAKQLGGTGSDGAQSIAVDAAGYVYTTGGFEGIADFDPETTTFNLTSAGFTDIFIHKMGQTISSISENSLTRGLIVFPNPSSGHFSIEFDDEFDDISIIVYDLIGKEVFRKKSSLRNIIEFSIDGHSGIYFIKLEADNERALLKVIKE